MPSHNEIHRAASDLQLGSVASELHGSLVGYLLGGGLVTPGRWLDDLLIEVPPGEGHDEARRLLDAFALATTLPLAGASTTFAPLLPDATSPLRDRAQALTDWCSGFLGGLGISGTASHADSGPVADLLGNIARIAATRWPKSSTPDADAVHFEGIVGFLVDAVTTHARELPRIPLDASRH